MSPIRRRLTHRRAAPGFTIVEMLLALSGVAFLLLFVVFAIMHVTGLYTKGIALRQINQTGREVTDELAREYVMAAQLWRQMQNRLCVGGKVISGTTAARLPTSMPMIAQLISSDLTTRHIVPIRLRRLIPMHRQC